MTKDNLNNEKNKTERFAKISTNKPMQKPDITP